MKLLILCAVLSVCLTVALANPVNKEIDDEPDISSSSLESAEQKVSDNKSSSSSSEEQEASDITVRKLKVEDNKAEEDNSSDASEELQQKNEIVHDEINENLSGEEQELSDENTLTRNKRYVIFAPHNSNQLSVKDEGTIKYEKYLKLKSDFQDNHNRHTRQAHRPVISRFVRSPLYNNTSEDDSSSEEEYKRRKRNLPISDSSEEDSFAEKQKVTQISEEISSEEDQETENHVNEVLIFSQEKETDSEEILNDDKLHNLVVNDKQKNDKTNPDLSLEYQNSAGEDMAVGYKIMRIRL